MTDSDPLQKLGSQRALRALHILRSADSNNVGQPHANAAEQRNFIADRATFGNPLPASTASRNEAQTDQQSTICAQDTHSHDLPPPRAEAEWFERFAGKVSIAAQGCWEWMSSRTPLGYGQFSIGNFPRYAHRLAYELWRGDIPAGMSVLHTCDNPYCVNPDHLWLGTQAENMRDRHAKGWHLKDRAAKRLSLEGSKARQSQEASTG